MFIPRHGDLKRALDKFVVQRVVAALLKTLNFTYTRIKTNRKQLFGCLLEQSVPGLQKLKLITQLNYL